VFLMGLLKHRRERYRTIHKKDLNIKVSKGTFTYEREHINKRRRRGSNMRNETKGKVSKGTFTLYFDWIFFCLYNIIMYVIIRKQKCIQCDELKNLLDEKGIQYNYLDMTVMPHKTMTYLRMYCNSFPIVLLTSFSSTNYYPTTDLFENVL
jgi:glutaredoxin